MPKQITVDALLQEYQALTCEGVLLTVSFRMRNKSKVVQVLECEQTGGSPAGAPVMADSTRAAFWPASRRRAALDVRKCVYRPACISVMRQHTTSTTCGTRKHVAQPTAV